MTLADGILIFVSGFASVFLLGFQSRAVNAGGFKTAACMSFTLAMFQGHLWKLIANGDGSLLASAIYGLSGSCAITSAMWTHRRFFSKK